MLEKERESMVKGKTKSGIAFQLDERIKDDARLMHLLVKMQEPMEDAMLAGKLMNQLLALVFGSDDGVFAFMNEVAEKHNGVCSTQAMLEELTEMFDAIKAKN